MTSRTTNQKVRDRDHGKKSRSRARGRKLFLEQLEDRRLLASYAWDSASGTLAITLGTGENLSFSETGGTRSFTLSSGLFTPSGNPATGDGSATISFIDPTDDISTSVSVDNVGAGAGANHVTFAGGTLTSASISIAAVEAGTTSAIDFTAATTLDGNVSLTSNGAGITDSTGSVSIVNGTTALNAGTSQNIVLDDTNNNFDGAVSVVSANNVTLNDTGAIDLGASTISGALSVTAGGAVSNSGNLSVAGLTTISAAGQTVTLDSAGNNFASLIVTAASAEFVDASDGLVLAGGNVGGALRLTTVGGLTQTAAVTAGSLGARNSGSGDVNLGTHPNAIGTFAANNAASGGEASILFDSTARSIGSVTAGSVFVATGGITTNNGAVTVGSASGTPVNLGADISSGGGAVTFPTNSASVILTANVGIHSAGGNVTVDRPVNADGVANNRTLTLTAGGGDVSLLNVGATTNLGTFTIVSANNASLRQVATRSGGISVTASGAITLNDNLTTDALATAGPVALNGNVLVAAATVTIDTDSNAASGGDGNIGISGTINGDIAGRSLVLTATGTGNNSAGNVLLSGAVGGIMPLTNLAITSGSLSAGAIDVSTALDVTITGAANITGTIAGTGATVTKGGAGLLILSGSNSYTGATTINSGTLDVTGSTAAGSAVSVNGGGTLAGTGTVGGSVAVNSGGTIAPGTDGTVGTLTVGTLSFNGGTYKADVFNDTSDTIVSGGTIDLAAVTQGVFQFGTVGGTTTDNNAFTLIDNTHPTNPIVDPPLSGAAEGSSTTVNAKTAVFSYAGGAGGNDLTLTVASDWGIDGTTGDDDFELRRVTGPGGVDNLQLLIGGSVVESRPIGSVNSMTVNGLDGNDTLTVNYTASGGFFAKDITFNGGDPDTAPGDALFITGGTFTTVTYNYDNASDGNIELDTSGSGSSTIAFTGLEPITNTGAVAVAIFNLPDGGNPDATLADHATPGMMQLTGSTFENTTFAVPSSSLTINGGTGADDITVASVDSTYRASLIISGSTGSDAIHVDADLTLGSATSAGNLTLTAEAITTSATSIATDAGTNAGSVAFIGPVTSSAGLAIDTDASGTDGNVLFGSTLGLGGNLSVTAGVGNVTFTDAVAIGAFDLTVVSSAVTLVTAGISGSTGNIDIAATTRTDVDGAITLTGAGNIQLDRAVVSGANVTSAGGNITFDGPASTNTGTVAVSTGAGGGDVLFNSTLGLGGALNVTAGTGDATLTGAVTIGTHNLTVVSSNISTVTAGISGSTGSVNIAAATRTDMDGAIALSGAGTVELDRAVVSGVNVTTGGGNITFDGPAALDTGAVQVSTGGGGGNILFNNTLDGNQALTLVAGLGNITATGAVGGTTPLTSISISSAANVTFSSTVQTTGNVSQSAGSGTTTLNGTSGAGIGGNLSVMTNAITLDSAVVTTAGSASLNAQNAISVTAGSGLNAGASAIAIAANQDGAGAQGFTQASGTTIQTTNTGSSAIALMVNTVGGGTGNAAIAALQTGAGGTVAIQTYAGAITDSNGSSTNITAGSATLSAGAGIGSGDALETTIDTLVAVNSTSGNIEIVESNGLTIGAGGVVTQGDNGAIDINVLASDLTVNGPVTAHGSGAISLNVAAGSASLNAAVSSTSGQIDLLANVNVNQNAGGNISTGGTAAVNVTAATGVITMADGTTTVAGSGPIALNAAGDVTLGGVSTSGAATVNSSGGSVLDGGDTHTDIAAATAIVTAGSGTVGTGADALDTAVANLEGSSTGGFWLTNTGNLIIGGISAVNGVSAGGDIVITANSALDVAEDVISSGGFVLLTAAEGGPADHLTVRSGATVESQASTVELRAGDNMTLADCSTVKAATTITLRGDHASNDSAGSIMNLLGTLDAGDGNYNVLVYGGPNADVITLNPGANHSADSTWLDGGGGDDTYHIYTERLNGGAEAATIDDTGGGNDRATVYATDVAENIHVLNNVDDQTLAQTGGYVDNQTTEQIVRYTNALERLTVRGEGGMDTLFVKPSQTTEITIHGGAPTFGPNPGDVPQVTPGDTLDFNSYDNTFLLICGTILTNDDLGINHQGASFQPVHYRNIENMPLTPLGTTTWRFDMDSTPAETQTDYTSVLPSTVYDADDPLSTHGWNAVMNGFDRGAGPFSSSFTDLLRDGHWHSASRTFTAEVEDGWYLVSIKTGDKSFARNQLRVTHGDTGQVLIDNLASPAGQIVDRAFVMLVQDGTLDLTFANLGGDPYWVVNSIEIRPGEILTFGSPETDIPLVADGVTETTIFGYNATADALITIDPQLDTQGNYLPEGTVTILGTDADPDVAGFQVEADGSGVFSYTIVRPSVAGTLRVLYTEVTGEQASCFSLDFVAPSIRRFDFNSGASPTQTPVAATPPGNPFGYTGVLPTELTSPTVGYGWVTAASGFDRGALASPGYSDLLRDGAWSSGPRDFRIQLPAGQDYDVTVTFGDASFARDQMNVTVLTGSAVSGLVNVTGVATAAGQQVHRSFVAAPDAQGELVLRFSDTGGDPYWTVNAVEVRAVYAPFTVSGPGGSLLANGTALDTFTVTGYTPNAWYTVSSDMGQVATGDGDPRYAGVQIQAPGAGAFTFDVQRGTGAGTANVRVEEVNGESRGSTTQVYVYNPLRQFDFNGSAVDTETAGSTWWSVRGGDVYLPAVGHGWDVAVSEFQRSAAGISEPQLDSLYRDGHWQSATRTFQVGVDPTKTYDVRIHTGDRSFARNQLQVSVEGAVLPLVATAANEFETITVTVPANTVGIDGILDIQIANLGGDPYWVINGIEVAESTTGLPVLPSVPVDPPVSLDFPLRFDFDSASSPTAGGFTGVGTSNAYNPTLGYGWQTTASTFSRSGPTDLLRDGHWGTSNTFSVNVPGSIATPVTYLVNVTLGDASFARNNISVSAEGGSQLSGLATAAGQFIHRSFEVEVTDGQLNVQIASTGGDPYFTINALEVFNVAQTALTFEIASNPVTEVSGDADGTTDDTITVNGATNGQLYTVTADLGTIQGTDASTAYAGFQVLAGGASFSFDVRRPTGIGSGTPQIRVEQVTGQAAGSLDQEYTLLDTRRFDFDGTADDTETGFLGVRGNQLYSAAAGHGWTVPVPEFQRATTSKISDALYRDGHWGSAARTFQVQVDSALDYDVRVYVGDASFARDNIEVSVDGGANWEVATATAADDFTTVLIEDIDPATDTLDIMIRNNGGDPYWVVNGIEVWDSASSDPSELLLLAASWSNGTAGDWLTDAAVAAVLPTARDYWISTGLSDVQLAELYRTPVAIGDLSHRGALGVSKPEGIWLDASGAGLGWSVGSGQWAVVSGSQTTANGQLPTAAYDLLTVLTHELGHVLGYDDLDPQQHPDHIMAGVLQPGTSRIATPTVDSGLTWTFGESASLLSLDRAGRQPTAIADRAVQLAAVDRVLDDLLRDDLRVSRDAWQRDEDEEFERLLTSRSSERHDETDDFFAQL